MIELVRRARAGDERAFEALYRATVGRVYAVCHRLVGDRARAEDLTQEVFVRAWQHLGSFRGESAFASWLHRIAVNVVLSAERAEARSRAHVAVDAPDRLDAYGVGGDPGAGPDLDLEEAIAALPAAARTVFVLHDVEGYGHDEIARFMGIAAGTSKAHLFRARRLLREALER